MRSERRQFLTSALAAGGTLWGGRRIAADEIVAKAESEKLFRSVSTENLKAIAAAPVLDLGRDPGEIKIRSVEVLKSPRDYLVRVRATDGTEGIAAGSGNRLDDLYPFLVNRVAPFFVGKDAAALESLLVELYRHGSNYKYQGLALWCSVAVVEMAILDLLGKVSGRSFGQLFGGIVRTEVPVYRASGNRGNRAEEEVDYLASLLDETGGDAVKFRLGGRMSQNVDSLPGRSEALIRLARERLGDRVTLYADANSSYDVPNSIRVGRLMEDYEYEFFEEPCPFDHLWETKEVADALDIPVAGGEQEFSERRFIWTIANHGVDVVQPDLHYYGGFIRSIKVARMAEAANLPCTPHMSGAGLGYLYVVHFASCVKDPGAHQEYKGRSAIPMTSSTSSLVCEEGKITVPTGPGLGVEIDSDFLKGCEVIG